MARHAAWFACLVLAACQAPLPRVAPHGPLGPVPSEDPQALAKAIAAATGEVLGVAIAPKDCDPRAQLALRTRQPLGRETDHTLIGWSPGGTGFATAAAPLLPAADGTLYVEAGGRVYRVGTWGGERRPGAPVTVALDPGARWLVGFPPALYHRDGWATIRLDGPPPAPAPTPSWLLDADLPGDPPTCATPTPAPSSSPSDSPEVKPSLPPA